MQMRGVEAEVEGDFKETCMTAKMHIRTHRDNESMFETRTSSRETKSQHRGEVGRNSQP